MSHTTFLAGALLRWVTRRQPAPASWGTGETVVVRVLQQGLRPATGGPVQWFDVPDESEVPL